MKLELNVKKINNEDIIATSSSCATTHLYKVSGNSGLGLVAFDLSVGEKGEKYEGNVPIPNEQGFYHLVDGKFVKCTTWNGSLDNTNFDDVFEAHGIENAK